MLSTHTMPLRDISIFIATDWSSWDDLVAAKPPVATVSFDYEPGQREIIRADPDDCQEGFPESYRVHAIVLAEDALFNGDCSTVTIKAGTDLFERVNPHFVEQLEADIAKAKQACAYEPDYAREAA